MDSVAIDFSYFLFLLDFYQSQYLTQLTPVLPSLPTQYFFYSFTLFYSSLFSSFGDFAFASEDP
jgi:hypothetical protein